MAHSTFFTQFTHLLQQARRLNLQANNQPKPQLKSPSRRRFIRTTAIGGAAFTTLGTLSGCHAEKTQVAIVGGGLAGLNAAYQLNKVGIVPTIYESSQRVGGRVRTVSNTLGAGLDTDLGGELINTDHEDMLALIEDFGITLTSRLQPNPQLNKVGYYYNGYQRSEAEMAAALQPFAQQLMIDAELLDEDWDTYAPLFDAQPLNDYLDMHSDKLPSDPDIRYLIESAVRVEYGVEPHESPIIQLLYLLPTVDGNQVEVLSTSDEAYVVNGGSEQIVQALKGVLSDQIKMEHGLTALSKTSTGYELIFNGNKTVRADYVILALPFTALRNVQINVELPETLSRFIQEVDLGRNEKIIVGVNEKSWRNGGFEVEAWNDQSASLLWDSSLRQPELPEGSLTFFLGANEIDDAFSDTASAKANQYLAEYDALIPGLQNAANGKQVRTAWHKTPGILGGYTNFKPGQYTEFSDWLYIEADDPEEAQDVKVDRLIFAGEHTSDEYYGFMNGAAQTGRLAATCIIYDIAQALSLDISSF